MNLIQEIYDLTNRLYQLVSSTKKNDNQRDVVIEQIEELLSERQLLLEDLDGFFSAKDHQIGKEIVNMNKIIDEKLDYLKSLIQSDLINIKRQKVSNEKYINPYKNLSTDGTFFDKKK
ncbi:flagellar protein FliT [Bacillus pinisoli]|uniref:flagellar protein FliT n=1 Tax=Bacillus pinisoli TaxID=2901866 RepID=UPI001FF5C98F|nr:flagellar protein FliT [Bacillus pinisoli]